ncbi:MAG TPA: hypothetical protein VHA82_14835 [Ramlibacter sp.]|nr:hypothetical protein [Ramlibacter sp.]
MANAAEQAVLRRVAPALKHDMVVHLQAAAMLAEMLNARVERGLLNPQDLQANLGKLNRLAREAVAGCLKVINWIDCPPEESVAVHEGVRECAGLLAASFNFRGFTIVDDVASTEFEVGRRALRHLLAASLLTLADEARDTGELVIESEIGASHAVVSVRWQARPRDPDSTIPPASGTAPRQLVDWSEVQALAAAEGTEVTRTPERIAIRLPRAVVTSPLQMAPV